MVSRHVTKSACHHDVTDVLFTLFLCALWPSSVQCARASGSNRSNGKLNTRHPRCRRRSCAMARISTGPASGMVRYVTSHGPRSRFRRRSHFSLQTGALAIALPLSLRLRKRPVLPSILHETAASKQLPTEDMGEISAKFVAITRTCRLTSTKATHLAERFSIPRPDLSESLHASRKGAGQGLLIQGKGADKAYGLETELVALTNPYAPEFNSRNACGSCCYRRSAAHRCSDRDIRAHWPGRQRLGPDRAHKRCAMASRPVRQSSRSITRILLDAVLIRPGTREGAIYDTLWAEYELLRSCPLRPHLQTCLCTLQSQPSTGKFANFADDFAKQLEHCAEARH